MSDTILGGDLTVFYLSENRQKRIEWTGSPTGTQDINAVYSAAADLMDDLTQMDDGSIFSAQTPTEYTIGSIDPSDAEAWFIDRTTVEHLTGGALITKGWERTEGATNGIIRMDYTENVALVSGDIGLDILMTIDGDRGTLLDYNEDTNELWIRPDSDNIVNSFNDAATADGDWTIVGGTGTGAQANGPATSDGQSLWSNAFTLGAIVVESHLYMYQNALKVTTYKGATPDDWWADGQIDVLIPIQILDSTPIDEGFISVFARQYGSTYSHFVSDVSAGGRNPIPLSAGGDLDNVTAWRTFTGNTGNNTFDVGNWMYVGASWAAASVKALIMSVGGTTSDPVLGYTLLGDLTDFSGSDAVTEYIGTGDGDADCIAGAPGDTGPASSSITIVHANTGVDIDEDGNDERYSVTVDLLSSETAAEGYEFSKHETKRGTVTTDTTDGITGESYIGNEYRIAYGGESGTIAEGTTVLQANTLATGIVVANHTTADILVLRNTRGTFNNSDQIDEGGNNVTSPTSVAITPINAAPFGTFAGGTWFLAPGVVVINNLSEEANDFQFTDDSGNVVTAPTKVNIVVSNTRALDRVTVFRLTVAGGVIEKDEFTSTVMSVQDTSLLVSGTIPADVPGVSVGGALRLVDDSAGIEYRLRYTSYVSSSGTFVLASTTDDTTEAGGNGTSPTKITATGAFATSQIGDLIQNQSRSFAVSYISNLVDANEVDIFPPIAAQASGDTFDINVVPVITTTSDTVYVPLIDKHETTGTDGTPGSESVNVTYLSDIDTLVRVRQAGDILPFEAPGTVETPGGSSVATIRTSDTIHN